MKGVPRHAVIDTITGEMFDIRLVPRKRSPGGWVKLFQQAKVDLMLRNPSLCGQSYRILAYLEGVSSWHNLIPGPAEVSKALDIPRPSVSRAYADLSDAGFIVKVGTRYHLSPMIAWKGTDREWDAFCRELYAPAQYEPAALPERTLSEPRASYTTRRR